YASAETVPVRSRRTKKTRRNARSRSHARSCVPSCCPATLESPGRAPAPLFRPARPLVARHLSHAHEHELLDPAALVGLGHVDIAPRVGGDAVRRLELARVAAL